MRKTPEEIAEIERNLSQFSGTERYHRLTMIPVKCTDGVKYLAESCGAFWLLDAIFAHYVKLQRLGIDEVFATLTVNLDKQAAVLVGTDGDGRELFKQKIRYTDFPLPKVKIWVMDGVAMLPNEY
jgi:hypothetical protein